MFLDIVGVITTSKLSILSTFQGGLREPPPCQVGLTLSGVGQNDTTEVSKYGEPNSSTILFQGKDNFTSHHTSEG